MFNVSFRANNGSTHYVTEPSGYRAKSTGVRRNAWVFKTIDEARSAAGVDGVVVWSATGLNVSGPHYLTVEDIKRINGEVNHHWFDPATLRFFSSRVGADVFEGTELVLFVSSERGPNGRRAYTVRRFHVDTGEVSTYGGHDDFMAYATRARAITAAKRATNTP